MQIFPSRNKIQLNSHHSNVSSYTTQFTKPIAIANNRCSRCDFKSSVIKKNAHTNCPLCGVEKLSTCPWSIILDFNMKTSFAIWKQNRFTLSWSHISYSCTPQTKKEKYMNKNYSVRRLTWLLNRAPHAWCQ